MNAVLTEKPMFRSKVVIVVGAGAGFEYNMPLGSVLASEVAESVRFKFEHHKWEPTSGDVDFFNLISRHCGQNRAKLDSFTKTGNTLASVMASCVSVDDALYQLSENQIAVNLGKAAIVRAILKAERNSTIILSPRTGRLDEESGREGWIEKFFSMATSEIKTSKLDTAFTNVTFVNFNYDRCIEHYLFWSLRRLGIADTDAADIVANLNMIRPYGSVGSTIPGSPDFLLYGSDTDPFKASSRIRTYTESEVMHKPESLEAALLNAALVLFLGFGFHAQNLGLFQLTSVTPKKIIATVKNVHSGNLPEIGSAISSRLRNSAHEIELFDMTAPEMLRDLRLKIMMRAG